jgi:hypothetical protein
MKKGCAAGTGRRRPYTRFLEEKEKKKKKERGTDGQQRHPKNLHSRHCCLASLFMIQPG